MKTIKSIVLTAFTICTLPATAAQNNTSANDLEIGSVFNRQATTIYQTQPDNSFRLLYNGQVVGENYRLKSSSDSEIRFAQKGTRVLKTLLRSGETVVIQRGNQSSELSSANDEIRMMANTDPEDPQARLGLSWFVVSPQVTRAGYAVATATLGILGALAYVVAEYS